MVVLSSLFRNSLFSIATNIVNRLGNALILILIVNKLGAEYAGVYLLGVSYFFIGSRFAFWGLDHLLTREVSKARHKASRFVSNFALTRFALASLSVLIFYLFIQSTNYEPDL